MNRNLLENFNILITGTAKEIYNQLILDCIGDCEYVYYLMKSKKNNIKFVITYNVIRQE